MPLLETIKGIFGGRIFTKDASESDADQLSRLQRLLEQAKRNGDADEAKEIQAEIDALGKQKESKDDSMIEEGLNKALSFAGLDSKTKDASTKWRGVVSAHSGKTLSNGSKQIKSPSEYDDRWDAKKWAEEKAKAEPNAGYVDVVQVNDSKTKDGTRPPDSVIAKWKSQAPANLKDHPQWSESDYAYFKEKGYSDAEIKQKWDSEVGKGPTVWKKNPWNDSDKAFTPEEAQEIAAKAGVDLGKYDLKEFCNGLSVELEHSDLTAGDPSMTAKIVIAHLNEIPDYYTRLAKMEASAKTKDASKTKDSKQLGQYKGYNLYLVDTYSNGDKDYQGVDGEKIVRGHSIEEVKAKIDQGKYTYDAVSSYMVEFRVKGEESNPRKVPLSTKELLKYSPVSAWEGAKKWLEQNYTGAKLVSVSGLSRDSKSKDLYTKDKKRCFRDKLRKAWRDALLPGDVIEFESRSGYSIKATVKNVASDFIIVKSSSGNQYTVRKDGPPYKEYSFGTKDSLRMTSDPEERRKQKELLRGLYPDYDPKRHDAFVARYNAEEDKKNTNQYMKNRGIIDSKTRDGGVGSGIKGHVTAKQLAAMKARKAGQSSSSFHPETQKKIESAIKGLISAAREGDDGKVYKEDVYNALESQGLREKMKPADFEKAVQSVTHAANQKFREMKKSDKQESSNQGAYKGSWGGNAIRQDKKGFYGYENMKEIRGSSLQEVKQKMAAERKRLEEKTAKYLASKEGQEAEARARKNFEEARRSDKKTSDGGIGSGIKGHITPKQIEAMKKRKAAQSSALNPAALRRKEKREAILAAQTHKYPDTGNGAIEALKMMSVHKCKNARAIPDQAVDGVWKVIHDGKESIVYLAGYKDPQGQIRKSNDFEDLD